MTVPRFRRKNRYVKKYLVKANERYNLYHSTRAKARRYKKSLLESDSKIESSIWEIVFDGRWVISERKVS